MVEKGEEVSGHQVKELPHNAVTEDKVDLFPPLSIQWKPVLVLLFTLSFFYLSEEKKRHAKNLL